MGALIAELREGLVEEYGSPVELIETHISWVLLAGDRAYKLKKPLRFEFLDYGDVGARHRACLDELRLNRRLAPDVYLEVAPLTRDARGALRLGGSAEPLDWVVVMRRLDERRTLDDRLREGTATPGDLAALAERLAEFYRQAERASIEPEAYRQRIAQHLAANRQDLLGALPATEHPRIAAVQGRQAEFLALHPAHFDARVAAGRIVDGHGDLRPEHVYFDPGAGVLVFDCVEFSAELRTVDVADELCFLAMECDALRAADVGQQVLRRCLAALGDRVDAPLEAFYKAYRACVRAKVAALRAHQIQGAAEQAAERQAGAYLALAECYAQELGRPRLIVVRGLMGTGKTTLATELARKLAAQRLSTDDLRRERFGASPTPAEFGRGHYASEPRRQIYAELLAAAEQALSREGSVILDGSFTDQAECERVADLGRRRGDELTWLECQCPAEVARQRIAARHHEGGHASEARVELFDAQRRAAHPHEGAATIDTTQPLEAQVAAALRAIAGTP